MLEGSVRRAGDRIRVTAQLIAAADGTHLWSERFDRPMTDVFAMQDEIAAAITTALVGTLGAAVATARQYTPDCRAYESLLRGRAHLGQFAPESWHRARAHFEQAIALDTALQRSARRARARTLHLGMHGFRPMRDVVPSRPRRGPSGARTQPVGSAAACFCWVPSPRSTTTTGTRPGKHFAASMQAANVSASARWIHASLYLRGLGRLEEAAIEMARVVEQDPLNPTWHSILSAHLIDAGRFDEAVHAAERATEIDPKYFLAEHMLAEAYWASRPARARRWRRTNGRDASRSGTRSRPARYAAALWHSGERARAEAIIEGRPRTRRSSSGV